MLLLVAGSLAAPRRPECRSPAVDESDKGAVIVEQYGTRDILPPQPSVCTLTRTRFSEEQHGAAVAYDGRRMYWCNVVSDSSQSGHKPKAETHGRHIGHIARDIALRPIGLPIIYEQQFTTVRSHDMQDIIFIRSAEDTLGTSPTLKIETRKLPDTLRIDMRRKVHLDDGCRRRRRIIRHLERAESL